MSKGHKQGRRMVFSFRNLSFYLVLINIFIFLFGASNHFNPSKESNDKSQQLKANNGDGVDQQHNVTALITAMQARIQELEGRLQSNEGSASTLTKEEPLADIRTSNTQLFEAIRKNKSNQSAATVPPSYKPTMKPTLPPTMKATTVTTPIPTPTPTTYPPTLSTSTYSQSKKSPAPSNTTMDNFPEKPNVCRWAPNSNGACLSKLSQRLPAGARRWLFFGDSTMMMMMYYTRGNLADYMIHQGQSKLLSRDCRQRYSCETKLAGRCNLTSFYGLEGPEERAQPDWLQGIGPVGYANMSDCQDCTSCHTHIPHCEVRDASRPLLEKCRQIIYGGYFSLEFAKDVELQSSFYKTSQENVVHFVSRTWNAPQMLSDFGKPVCVVATGLHDINLGNLTQTQFLKNVRWYLGLLRKTCDHIIWLTNIAPLAKLGRYAQTKSKVRLWNEGVEDLLSKPEYISNNFSVMDVFNASLDWPHKNEDDNLHMDTAWYRHLAGFFVTLSKQITNF